MKKSKLFRLFVLVATMMCALGASAIEAYACYTSSNTTLTFYYDNYRSSRTGTIYDLNTGSNYTDWDEDGTKSYVTKVVFDPSFAGARPTTTFDWFYGMQKLQSFTGMSYLNTSEVTNMSLMFQNCTQLTSLDLSHFNTSKVTDMGGMFSNSTSLTSLDLSSFNTSKVTNMGWMFSGCSNLRTIYVGNGWNTAAVTASSNMFTNCTSLVGGQGTTYNSSNPTDKTYAHIDGGSSNPGYFSEKPKESYACYTSSNTTLTFYYDSQRSSRSGTTYDLNTGSNLPGWYNDGTNANVTNVVFDSSFANVRPTRTSLWFYEMVNLESITGIAYLNTSEVTDMSWMFADCEKLASLDVSNFNTAKATDMSYMFRGCELLTSLDVSNFNTAKVTNMTSMFGDLTALTSLNVSNFNTSNVTSMSGMFSGCSSLTSLDVRNFNTAKVVDMSHMFRCKALQSIDLSNFNTSKVTNMGYMFNGCNALTTLNLGSFNTSKVTYMWMMFFDCRRLRTIYVSDGWSTAAVTGSGSMFAFCNSLVGGQGTTYDENHEDAAYAHIDGGPSNPGYFTKYVSLDEALNVASGTLHFVSTGDYPWTVAEEGSRVYAKSGNTGVHSSVSEMTATVTVNEASNLSFDFKAWGEGTTTYWDYCAFFVDGNQLLYYGAYDNDWERFTVELSAGTHTLKWMYSKDSNVSPTGDYFAVDNVAITSAAGMRGDVDGNSEVGIADVTALIHYLLTGDATGVNTTNADCDQGGDVGIADVTTLISYLLTGNWPD